MDLFDECETPHYARVRCRRSSRSMPSTPRTSTNTGYEDQLVTKLVNVSISDIARRRRLMECSNFPQRSSSCKHRRRLDSNEFRPRTTSMPSRAKRPSTLAFRRHEDSVDEVFVEVMRVRTFSSSDRGIINRGDSFKRRRNRSGAGSSVTSQGSSVCSTEALYSVLVMGPTGVGKSSLIKQFTTSEYMGGAEVGEDESGCSVPVLLDDTESILLFNELPSSELVPTSGVDAYIMIYSIDDHDSFDEAILSLYELRKTETAAAVILVANKADMIRHRKVSQEEGKLMAERYDCKYIEVSTVLNLKVDELLAGILTQIRLTNKRPPKKGLRKTRKCQSRDDIGCIGAKGLVGKLFKSSPPKFNSCDNLLVL